MATVRVLIVEDDPVMSMHLEGLVEETLQAEIEISASVADAEHALKRSFDLALLDIDVTDGKTYLLAARLIADDVPLAFVSASDAGELPPSLRGVPFVAKPYVDHDIVGLLGNLRRRAS